METIKLYQAYNGSVYTKDEIVPLVFEGSPAAMFTESKNQLSMKDEEFDEIAIQEEWKVKTYRYEVNRITNDATVFIDEESGMVDLDEISDDDIKTVIINAIKHDEINFNFDDEVLAQQRRENEQAAHEHSEMLAECAPGKGMY
jgi:hypothetical protein